MTSAPGHPDTRLGNPPRVAEKSLTAKNTQAALPKEIEDRMDVAAARKALAGKSKRIPLLDIVSKYGVS